MAAELLARDGRLLRLPVEHMRLLFFDVERRLEALDGLEGRQLRPVGTPMPVAEWIVVPFTCVAAMPVGAQTATFCEYLVWNSISELGHRSLIFTQVRTDLHNVSQRSRGSCA